GRGRSSSGCPRRSWYHDGRRRWPIEHHFLHQLGEARVVAQRIDDRMHSKIRRPPTTLVDGAIDPVERFLIVAKSERDENPVAGRYVVGLDSLHQIFIDLLRERLIAGETQGIRERRPGGVGTFRRQRQSLAQDALSGRIIPLQRQPQTGSASALI